jgi:hypothetical protein
MHLGAQWGHFGHTAMHNKRQASSALIVGEISARGGGGAMFILPITSGLLLILFLPIMK